MLQDQLCSVIEGWKTMSLDQKQKVCTSLSACTRVVGTEAPKLTADLDKMPFSKQEWYDLEIPISTQTSVQFEESGKSPEDLFRETQTAKAQLDPLLLCTSTQPGLGEVNAFTWDESDECVFWRAQKQTKPEILHCCADLKVLGKREFRTLLTWRLKMAALWAKEQAR